MNIDGFTFAAQVINFLILVFLLRWFLYGPVIRAMEQREANLESRRREAQEQADLGARRAQEYEEKLKAFEEERERLLHEVRQETEQTRKQWLAEAQQAVQLRRNEWTTAFEREQQHRLDDLRKQVGHLATQATAEALRSLSDVTLEQRVIEAFTQRLTELPREERDRIQAFIAQDTHQVVIRSAFELTPAWEASLRTLVQEQFGEAGNVEFEQDPELICGIELHVGGYCLSWNMHDFLRHLDLEFQQQITRPLDVDLEEPA